MYYDSEAGLIEVFYLDDQDMHNPIYKAGGFTKPGWYAMETSGGEPRGPYDTHRKCMQAVGLAPEPGTFPTDYISR